MRWCTFLWKMNDWTSKREIQGEKGEIRFGKQRKNTDRNAWYALFFGKWMKGERVCVLLNENNVHWIQRVVKMDCKQKEMSAKREWRHYCDIGWRIKGIDDAKKRRKYSGKREELIRIRPERICTKRCEGEMRWGVISSRDALLQYWALRDQGLGTQRRMRDWGFEDAKKGKTEEKGFSYYRRKCVQQKSVMAKWDYRGRMHWCNIGGIEDAKKGKVATWWRLIPDTRTRHWKIDLTSNFPRKAGAWSASGRLPAWLWHLPCVSRHW